MPLFIISRGRGPLLVGRTALLAATAMVSASAAWAQDASGTVSLDTILVEEEGNAVTDGTQSYSATVTTVGGKGAVPIREVPQTVNVVTPERIADQNMTKLEDAAQETPGLRVFRNDPGRSSIFSRGFEFDTYYVDGLAAPMSSAYGTVPDLAPFERVEFLKGPAALFAGSGEPGGIVNLARKRPGEDFRFTATARYGSWQNMRGELDLSTPLNEAGTVRGRGVIAYQDADSFVDVNDYSVAVGYGTIEVDLTDDTTFSLAAWRQSRDITPSNALPTFADGSFIGVDRSTYLGYDWNYFESNETNVLAELEHRFDGGGHARIAARFTNREAEGKYGYTGGPANQTTGAVAGLAAALGGEEESVVLDAHVSRPFELFGLEHNIIVGADYENIDRLQQSGAVRGFPANNIYAPNPNQPEPVIPYTRQSVHSTPEELGLYSQLRLKPVQPLTVILGGRASWYDADVTDRLTGTTTNVTHDGVVSPYAGVVLDLNDVFSVYASYTEMFQPQTEVDAAAKVLPPREATQYEAGIKAALMGGAVTASASVFRIEDINRAIGDPSNPGASLATGQIDSQGFEVELTGSPLPGLDLYAGYGYLDMQYAAASSTLSYRYYLPKHTFNLWAKYTFQQEMLRGLHVAGGLTAVGSFHNEFNGVTIEEDGYITVDAQVGYAFNETFSGSFTVTNIFDEIYYERLGTTGTFNFYGEPRAFMAEVKATF